jgi:hypothetical protein
MEIRKTGQKGRKTPHPTWEKYHFLSLKIKFRGIYIFSKIEPTEECPLPRLGDRKHTTRWIKIISHQKPWEILYFSNRSHLKDSTKVGLIRQK